MASSVCLQPRGNNPPDRGILKVMVMRGFEHGIAEGWWMFFDTFWALVLGFGLSGAVQAFVSKQQMQGLLGDHRPKTLVRSSFFGVVSSSCSYAASALAKSLFVRGADFTASMVFMVASTNLVVELGIVLWLLVGWQFAAAEFVGGAIMIVMLGLVLPRVIPARWIDDARTALNTGADDHTSHPEQSSNIRSTDGWADAAGYTVSDLTMLRKELVAGFVVAGFASALVPNWFWRSMFTTGHGFWSSLENVVLGPFLALISFVCSIGNVPLAAALWRGGISFGGVVAFVFADLITLPLLLIYRTYFGTRFTLRLLATFWATMSAAGLATEYLFRAVGLVPSTVHAPVSVRHAGLNATTVLDVIAAVAFGAILLAYRRARANRDADRSAYAKDVVCGMQVAKATAPARTTVGGATYYFCSDHCLAKFGAGSSASSSEGTEPPDSPGSFRSSRRKAPSIRP
jgi:uncharacterized protein